MDATAESTIVTTPNDSKSAEGSDSKNVGEEFYSDLLREQERHNTTMTGKWREAADRAPKGSPQQFNFLKNMRESYDLIRHVLDF